MMRLSVQIHPTPGQVRVLVTEPALGDVLKASLPQPPAHPRAMLTLLEGVALWSGAPLCAAIIAEPHYLSLDGSELFGDELWPGESPLVQYEVVARVRPKRLRGLGDFSELRVRAGRGVRW